MQYSYTQQISAPVERVFDFLYDENKVKQWIPELVNNEYDSNFDKEHPVGTVFIQRLREGGRIRNYYGEITNFKRNELLELRLWNKEFSVLVSYKLTPGNNSTTLNYSCCTVFFNWFYWVMGRLFSASMKRMLVKQLDKLKALAEA